MSFRRLAEGVAEALSRPRDTLDRIIDRVELTRPATVVPTTEWREHLGRLIEWNPGTEAEVQEVARALRPLGDFFSDADPEHAELLFAVTRATRPTIVVETGVSRGVSTRYLLEALTRNGHGHLWSVDRVPRRADFRGKSAAAVVDKERWTFVEGTSRRVLPGLLDQLGVVDIFVHDSAHTERNMLFEFRESWPHLPVKGLLVSDDVTDNRAFERFVAEVECEWVVGRQRRGGGFGVAVKKG